MGSVVHRCDFMAAGETTKMVSGGTTTFTYEVQHDGRYAFTMSDGETTLKHHSIAWEDINRFKAFLRSIIELKR